MRRPIDLSLYLVTSESAREDFLRVILASIEGGVKIVQLREKQKSTREICELGKKLLTFLQPKGIPLLINDRADIAHAIGADGVHLGQSDLRVSEARAILGQEAIIGLSLENINQALEARKEEVDYLAASPLFPSKTKPEYESTWGLKNLNHLCALSHHPIVAIGGIDVTNVQNVCESGVAGVAVVSAIFNAHCPESAAREILQKMRKS